jgi:hypothetical protein
MECAGVLLAIVVQPCSKDTSPHKHTLLGDPRRCHGHSHLLFVKPGYTMTIPARTMPCSPLLWLGTGTIHALTTCNLQLDL